MAVQQRHSRGKYQHGRLLVASPHLNGTPYDRAVVLVIEHSERGAGGVLLNNSFRDSLRRFRAAVHQQRSQFVFPVRLEVGVVNWGPNELDRELQSGIWMTTTATQANLTDEQQDLWVQLVRQIGRSVLREALHIQDFPPDPTIN